MNTLQPSVWVKPDPLSRSFHKNIEEDGLKVIVHQQNDDLDDSAKECEFNSCIRTLAITDLILSYDRAQLGAL